MSEKNSKWWFFHINLMGYNLFRNKKPISKCAAFWAGFTSDRILKGNSSIKAIKK